MSRFILVYKAQNVKLFFYSQHHNTVVCRPSRLELLVIFSLWATMLNLLNLNSMPEHLRQTTSIDRFKRSLKTT